MDTTVIEREVLVESVDITGDVPIEADEVSSEVPILAGREMYKGDKGESAYELAVKNGFKGSEEEWLESLNGKNGRDGVDGKDGIDGRDGYTPQKNIDYFDGKDGKDGVDGKDGSPGKDGRDGSDGAPGKDGEPGYTPRKGTDYFTEADKAELVDEVLAEIEIPEGEGGKVDDVQVNGASVVDENGVATIPIASTTGGVGLVRLGKSANGYICMGSSNGSTYLLYPVASANGFKDRKSQGSQYSGVVNSANIDLAVKYAMTDGKGTAWTEAEQKAARERMGVASLQEVLEALPIYEGEVESV